MWRRVKVKSGKTFERPPGFECARRYIFGDGGDGGDIGDGGLLAYSEAMAVLAVPNYLENPRTKTVLRLRLQHVLTLERRRYAKHIFYHSYLKAHQMCIFSPSLPQNTPCS